ncbi:hypothetical protein GGR55DRAFT_674448 [Xylaria sp. FL0064]|nr:hypothetical protein GGR55DRAFT_674448 [Xylaria sp. FL0064]
MLPKFYLEVITQGSLEGIKVCTLLCMYNVFEKDTVSLPHSSTTGESCLKASWVSQEYRFWDGSLLIGNTSDDIPSRESSQDLSTQGGNDEPGVVPPSRHRPVENVSFDSFVILCRLFGDPSYREDTKESLAATNASDPTRYEHSVLIERLDWDYENSIFFQWEPKMLGLGGVEARMFGKESFLDSVHPSGWS